MDFRAAMQLLVPDAKAGPDAVFEGRGLLNRLSDPICIIGPGHEIHLANHAFAMLFAGPGKAPLTGRPCYEVFHDRANPCPAHECPLEQGPASGGGTGFREYRHRDRDTERCFEAAFRPIPGTTGKTARFLVSMRDVTARKGLENELERSRTRYRQLFEHAREGIALVEPQGLIQECNPSLCHMLGYPQNELLSQKVWELARDESRKILKSHMEDLRLMGSVAVEMDFLRRGGRPLPVEADIIWLPDEGMFLLMMRDITVRKRLEASRKLYSEKLEAQVEKRTRELQVSQQQTVRREAFVQNLVHNSIDGIIATNPEGTIVIFNRGASRILGYEPEEIVGRLSYQDILSKATTRNVLRAFYGEQ